MRADRRVGRSRAARRGCAPSSHTSARSFAFTAAWQAVVAAIRCSASCTCAPRSSPSRSSASASSALALSSALSSAGAAVTLIVAPPKLSISKPNRSSSERRARASACCADGGDVEQHRHQQPLRFEPPRGELLHHPLEQHPLVRDVLIDDRQPLVVDRDDEGVAELAERNHRLDVRRRRRHGRFGTARSGALRLTLSVSYVGPCFSGGRLPPVRIHAAGQDAGQRRRERRLRRVLRPQLQLRRAAAVRACP